MADAGGLDPATLRRLRRVVQAANDGGVPRAELLRLAGDVGHGLALTIDFEAAAELGQPLVVLRPASQRPEPACLAGLSPREREVAGLLAQGLSNKAIARRLSIRLGTVKDHVHRILDKSGLESRLALMAIMLGDQASGG